MPRGESICLAVNCGYARVAIRTLSEIEKGKQHTNINQAIRKQKFREMFAMPAFQGSGPEYCENQHSRSLFDRHCKEILAMFAKNWKNRDTRQTYLTVFSVEKWKMLSASEKERHSLSNCKECARNYSEFQQAFPGPTFTLSPSDTAIRSFISEVKTANQMAKSTEKATTSEVLTTLSSTYESEFGESFTTALLKLPNIQVQRKPTDAEKKKNRKGNIRGNVATCKTNT